jgi:hypothetical protein
VYKFCLPLFAIQGYSGVEQGYNGMMITTMNMKKINWKGVEIFVPEERNPRHSQGERGRAAWIGDGQVRMGKHDIFAGPKYKQRDLEDYYLDDADETEAAGLLDCEDSDKKPVTPVEGPSGTKRRPRSYYRRKEAEHRDYLQQLANGVKPTTAPTLVDTSHEPDFESITGSRKTRAQMAADANVDLGDPPPVFELDYGLILSALTK